MQYLRNNFKGININYLIHKNRANGLTEDMMQDLRKSLPGLLFMPDSGSNDHAQLQELAELGVDVIILDHHVVDNGEFVSDNVVTVNPQLCLDTYPNENLAAGGIVYKFLQAMDDFYGLNDADSYLDLVAISTIADSMEQTEPESRYYIYKGLSSIRNPFIKQLIKKNIDWADEIFPKLISFNISNRINAIIRVGTFEEKNIVFRALLSETENTTRISKYRGVEREIAETLAEQASRLCDNARGRQNRRKAKLVEEAYEQIERNKIGDNEFIIVNLDDVPSGFSGLIAMTLAQTYNRPSVVVSKGENGNLVGSLRGNSGSAVEDIRGFLLETKLFEFVRGHEAAAGLAITEENFPLLNKTINSKLNFTSKDSAIEVDFELHSNSLSKNTVEEVDGILKYFGKGCEEPLFAITNIEIDCRDITFKNTTKFSKNGIEFLSFSVNKELEKLANQNKTVILTVIGTLGLNRFLGNVTHQVVIESLKINEIKETQSFGGFVF